jgi:plastocyanin
MLSNHFPQTYGHEYNWLILLIISAGGAAIREYFVVRLSRPKRSLIAGLTGLILITGVIIFSREPSDDTSAEITPPIHSHETVAPSPISESPNKVNSDDSQKNPPLATGPAVEINGVVVFEGQVPKNKKLNLPAACAKNHKGDAYSNEIIVTNGKVQNVLVRIISGLEGKTFTDVPTEEIELDQRGCMYTPRVVGARVGQKVTFINSDPVFHNVRSVTNENQRFNMAMPHQNQRETKIFKKPELFLQAKCSVHPWMGAFVAIMDHPYFSVTNAKGEFKIKNLPPGTYTIEIWHEIFGTQKQEITVPGSEVAPLKFIFK